MGEDSFAPGLQPAMAQPPVFAPEASNLPKYRTPQSVAKSDATMTLGGFSVNTVEGDNLWKLSERYFFDPTYWHSIYQANKDLCHADGSLIYASTVLEIPSLEVKMLDAILKCIKDDTKLEYILTRIDKDKYLKMRKKLPQATVEKHGRDLSHFEVMLFSGKTFKEIGKETLLFLDNKAAEMGEGILEQFVDPDEQEGARTSTFNMADFGVWQNRLDKIVEQLEKSAPKEIQQAIATARKESGEEEVFIFDPVGIEEGGAFAYTKRDSKLYVGTQWIEIAEQKVEMVYGNIVHELSAHKEYGYPLSEEVGDYLYEAIPNHEWQELNEKGNGFWTKFHYYETELWAELREAHLLVSDDLIPDVTGDAFQDEPLYDYPSLIDGGYISEIRGEVQNFYDIFPPDIAEAFLRAFYLRASTDNRIHPDTIKKFRKVIMEEGRFDPAK